MASSSFCSFRSIFNVCSYLSCCGGSDAQNGYTALMLAAENGHIDCVRLLVDAGAGKEAKSTVRRQSLLFKCARLDITLFTHHLFLAHILCCV
jgi:ankyrin repeat protein